MGRQRSRRSGWTKMLPRPEVASVAGMAPLGSSLTTRRDMTPTKKLEGKVALITGASRGIGRDIALRLASEGAFVLIHCGQGTTEAESTLRDVVGGGGRGAVIAVDLVKPGSARRLREEVDGVLGRIDV